MYEDFVFFLLDFVIEFLFWNFSLAIDCDFDNGVCGWKEVSDKTWITVNKSSDYDPGYDHTCAASTFHRQCGNWLSTTKKFTDQQEFTLVSPQLNRTESESCLSFWYHFFGLASSSFEVLVNGNDTVLTAESLWKRTTPQSNNFIYAEIYIPPQIEEFHLFFKAILVSRFNDTVGLDDILYSTKPCQKTLDEDFESKHSEWELNGNRIVNGFQFFDHTTHTALGHFVLSKGEKTTTTLRASMDNITFNTNVDQYCLKFWYRFFSNDNARTDLSSYIRVKSNLFNKEFHISFKNVYEDYLEHSWNEAFLELFGFRQADSDIIFTLYTDTNQTFIGVDDIKLTNDLCPILGDCDFESGESILPN